jgi:hypothetical protein
VSESTCASKSSKQANEDDCHDCSLLTAIAIAIASAVSMHQNDIVINDAVFGSATGRLNWFGNVTSGRSKAFGVASSVHGVACRLLECTAV